ncbi:unnamed protein product [Mytilus edulis]|uniref:Uncharacterized protein n=1 Tax=Mytilus edulis TaxID=6550 RepID=A0A8S3V7T5_MYTED|nr:unnamed protein product [Mytilus edulis]
MPKAAEQASDSCHTCASLKRFPKSLVEQSSEDPPDLVGISYVADVLKRNRQLILVVRETVTSYTSTCFIKDEKLGSLRDGLIHLLIPLKPLNGPSVVVRVDPAPGFRPLCDDSYLKQLNISIEIGRVKNRNKNPVADKAIAELEDELLREERDHSPLSENTLVIATTRLNSRLRQRGLSSRELWTQRSQFTHEQSKTQSRDRYLVVARDGEWCFIKKFSGNQLRASSYKVKLSECYKVLNTISAQQNPRYSQNVYNEESDSDGHDEDSLPGPIRDLPPERAEPPPILICENIDDVENLDEPTAQHDNSLEHDLTLSNSSTEQDNKRVLHFWKNEGELKLRLRKYLNEAFLTKESSFVECDCGIIEDDGLESLKIIEHVKRIVRVPTSFDGTFKEDDHSPSNIEGRTYWEKFLYFWLVVPRVQWDFFDMLYQMYTFDIFHQGVISKSVHFLYHTNKCDALYDVFSSVQLIWRPTMGRRLYPSMWHFSLFQSSLLLVFSSYCTLLWDLWDFYKSWEWGFVTFIILAVLYMTGNLWYYSYRTPGNPWYNPTNWYTNPLIWSYIISLVQASSHGFEQEIPPEYSGASHWESLHVFLWHESKNGKLKKQKSWFWSYFFTLAPIVTFLMLSVSVAWFSWPHLIGTEIIYIMAGIGYRADFFEKFIRIAEKAERSGNPIIDHFPKNKDDIHFGEHKKYWKQLRKLKRWKQRQFIKTLLCEN